VAAGAAPPTLLANRVLGVPPGLAEKEVAGPAALSQAQAARAWVAVERSQPAGAREVLERRQAERVIRGERLQVSPGAQAPAGPPGKQRPGEPDLRGTRSAQPAGKQRPGRRAPRGRGLETNSGRPATASESI